jgi:hypothetical protein
MRSAMICHLSRAERAVRISCSFLEPGVRCMRHFVCRHGARVLLIRRGVTQWLPGRRTMSNLGTGLALAILGAWLGAVACTSDNAHSCEKDGVWITTETPWTCNDGCNSCGCKDGSGITTQIACLSPPGPAAGKFECRERVGTEWHTHGTMWTCEDGCSACSCDDGKLSVDAATCGAAGAVN